MAHLFNYEGHQEGMRGTQSGESSRYGENNGAAEDPMYSAAKALTPGSTPSECWQAECSLGGLVMAALGALPGPAGKTKPLLMNARSLISRQGRDEMSGSNIKRLIQSMRENGYVGDPIEAARIPDGRLIIIDGHHRAAAAARVGIDVPVNVTDVGRESGDALMDEVIRTRR